MLAKRRIFIRDEEVKAVLRSLDSRRVFVIETAMLYYSRYLEENPGVEEVLYDSKKVNSDEEIVGRVGMWYKDLDCREKSRDELREMALIAMDAYIDGAEIENSQFKRIVEEEFTKMKFSQYPSKNLERKEKVRWGVVNMSLSNEKVVRMIDYAWTKTAYPGELIERAIKYYINLGFDYIGVGVDVGKHYCKYSINNEMPPKVEYEEVLNV